MKNGLAQRIPNWAFHPALTALPLAVMLVLILPDVFDKYTITPVSENKLAHRSNQEYHDLDHDGVSEMFIAGDNSKNGSALTIYYGDVPYFEWDFDGHYFNGNDKCLVTDADTNGFDEIYAFTMEGDSLLLNGIDFRKRNHYTIHNKVLLDLPKIPLDTIATFNDREFKLIGCADLTGDHCNELLFRITTGYTLKPRKIYAYDVVHDSLFASPELGGLSSEIDIADIDLDGRAELTVTNYGPGNMTDTTGFMPDNASYLIVLDNNLRFLFPPLKNPGTYSSVQSQFIKVNGEYKIISLWDFSIESNMTPILRIFDLTGKMIKESDKGIGDSHKKYKLDQHPFHVNNPELILNHARQAVPPLFFDTNLKPLARKIPLIRPYANLLPVDLDQDGKIEVLYETSNLGRYAILRENLKHAVFFTAGTNANDPPSLYIKLNGNEKPQFCLQADRVQYLFTYGFNPAYYWQYPVYLLIYLIVFGFTLLVRRIQRVQINRRYETEKRITELQLRSIRNQMDPHFTFNVLNTIGSVILQKKTDESYDLLMKFSKMIRTTIQSADMVVRTLKSELDFVRNYLELQSSRYEKAFSYSMTVDENIDEMQMVPKMVLQTYVENALRHGLLPRKNGGILSITIIEQKNYMILTITDNGIGREQSAKATAMSTGVGLAMMKQYYSILNRHNQYPISETITDLKNSDGTAAGTRVVVQIPINLGFDLFHRNQNI